MENELVRTEQMPVALLSQAIEKGSDIETLERLMNLQERWEKKEAEKAFKKAFSEFQANKPILVKNETVNYNTQKGTTKYDFLPLHGIQKLIDPVLSQFGLSYRWEQEEENNKIKITCIVSHLDGHEEKTWLKADSDNSGNKNSIQAIGSTVTYLKRYTLEGALGLSSGKDTDTAEKNQKPEPPKPKKKIVDFKGACTYVTNGGSADAIINQYDLDEKQVSTLIDLENAREPKKS